MERDTEPSEVQAAVSAAGYRVRRTFLAPSGVEAFIALVCTDPRTSRAAWQDLTRRLNPLGWTPVIVGEEAEDVAYVLHDWGSAGYSPEETVELSRGIDGKDLLEAEARRRGSTPDPDRPGEPSRMAEDHLLLPESPRRIRPVELVLVPCQEPWMIPAHFEWDDGGMLQTYEHLAVLRYLQKDLAAVLAFMKFDSLELVLDHPLDPATARAQAPLVSAYGGLDGGSLFRNDEVVAYLERSTVWNLWWDWQAGRVVPESGDLVRPGTNQTGARLDRASALRAVRRSVLRGSDGVAESLQRVIPGGPALGAVDHPSHELRFAISGDGPAIESPRGSDLDGRGEQGLRPWWT